MRFILTCLAALLLLIQYPLWFGKGGWLRVAELDQQVIAAVKKTEDLKARNAKLGSEVQDLKTGTGAVEERARYELGMIKENEVFIQVLSANTPAPELAVKPGKPVSSGVPPPPVPPARKTP